MTVEEKLIANSLEEPAWFAMSATFGRELKAKTFLESKSVKCFVPMKYQIVNDKKQGKIKKLAPAINNLILMPGDKFDFNTVVGERTAAKGYMEADAYSDGLTVSARGNLYIKVSFQSTNRHSGTYRKHLCCFYISNL